MSNLYLIVAGEWIEAIGATVKAIGETEELPTQSLSGKKKRLVGDAVQGVGNSLIAIGEGEDEPLAALGNWIQAIGTGSNSLAAYIEIYGNGFDSAPEKVEIIGDVLQAIGSKMTGIGLRTDSPTELTLMRAAGNDIQALGATIEGIGAVYLAKEKRDTGQPLQVAGGWGQVAGVVLQAIAATKTLKRAK